MYATSSLIDCKLNDKECKRFIELYTKANTADEYYKNFRWYNPVSWF